VERLSPTSATGRAGMRNQSLFKAYAFDRIDASIVNHALLCYGMYTVRHDESRRFRVARGEVELHARPRKAGMKLGFRVQPS
jgi:hypothetical protein